MEVQISVPLGYREPPLLTNLQLDAVNNRHFRKVLYTDGNLQVDVMHIPVGGQIGSEVHPLTTQFTRCEKGSGYVELNGFRYDFREGTVVTIPPRTQHNIVNTSNVPMSLSVVYSPPHHKPHEIDR